MFKKRTKQAMKKSEFHIHFIFRKLYLSWYIVPWLSVEILNRSDVRTVKIFFGWLCWFVVIEFEKCDHIHIEDIEKVIDIYGDKPVWYCDYCEKFYKTEEISVDDDKHVVCKECDRYLELYDD